jgi:hypothetical protein
VQSLPGITSNNDFEARFSLRGADFSRIGLYLDGILLHEPFHLVAAEFALRLMPMTGCGVKMPSPSNRSAMLSATEGCSASRRGASLLPRHAGSHSSYCPTKIVTPFAVCNPPTDACTATSPAGAACGI